MTTVLLVRHGESQANRRNIFVGHSDIALETRGIQQAEKTAEFIKENYRVDRIYASDLQRARKTGEIIAKAVGKPLETDTDLREIFAGKWEGVSFSAIARDFAADWHIWCNDLGRVRCPDGESVEELGVRIMSAVTRIAERNADKTIVVATHATPIRAMQCLVETGDITNMKKYSWVSNASVSEYTYDEAGWHCRAVGLDAHLAALSTGLPEGV